MQNRMPLQWIEEAEARTVLAAARFERPAAPSWCRCARQELSRRFARRLNQLRPWFAGCPLQAPLLQAQPALIRRSLPRR
ncbi:MAG TPA: hypothetical protein VNF04_11840 [Stellaceae bacterium]|nr:hypothetical protein [Stellaceae bacterium]